jgi:hypothetical protein
MDSSKEEHGDVCLGAAVMAASSQDPQMVSDTACNVSLG